MTGCRSVVLVAEVEIEIQHPASFCGSFLRFGNCVRAEEVSELAATAQDKAAKKDKTRLLEVLGVRLGISRDEVASWDKKLTVWKRFTEQAQEAAKQVMKQKAVAGGE